MKKLATFLVAGLVFGFLLVRAGATEYDAILGMFSLQDPHLFGVIGVAVAVAGLGFLLLRRRAAAGADVTLAQPKPVKPGLIVGGLLFGAGWALTGTCPGTGLAQIGEGKLMALATVGGILIGSALHRGIGGRVERWLAHARRPRRPQAPAPTVGAARAPSTM